MKSIAALLFLVSTASADVVRDRLVLVPTSGTACGPGHQQFVRMYEKTDGSSAQDTTEFRVPTGMYLDIASIEYTLPRGSRFTKIWTQYLEVTIRNRTTQAGYNILNAPFGVQSVLAKE